ILAAVEGGIVPPGRAACAVSVRELAMVGRMLGVSSAGLGARLYGSQDACRYFSGVRRCNLWIAAWSVHLMIISSMHTSGGRLAAQTSASAMSSARSGLIPS